MLAAAGIASRRKAEELIQSGRVSVDGQVVTQLGTRVDPLRARIQVDGKPIRGANRDTILVPPKAMLKIQFDADNPGLWAFHCHNLYHMAAGMFGTLVYRGFS